MLETAPSELRGWFQKTVGREADTMQMSACTDITHTLDTVCIKKDEKKNADCQADRANSAALTA